MAGGRALVRREDLPSCPPTVPRPGDRVEWFLDGVSYKGVLVGHHPDGSPRVRVTDTHPAAETRLESYQVLSVVDPNNRLGPNWTTLPDSAVVVRPTGDEADAFARVLSRSFPSGTSQIDLLRAIGHHGHEVFVTGGTVRDIICGVPPSDLDVVTTMPLKRLEAIGRGACPSWPELTEPMLLNGRHVVGEPFPSVMLDIAVFKYSMPGTESAIFGSDIEIDMTYRDFSINAIHFDPIHNIFYDPSGNGLDDASGRILRRVGDLTRRNDKQKAKVCIRAVRFCADGFKPESECLETITGILANGVLGALPLVELLATFRGQVMTRVPTVQRRARLDAARSAFDTFGARTEWERYLEPEEEELLS